MTDDASRKPATDWEAIEREYRAGQFSLRELGRQFKVSDTAIRKRAKADGWTRLLADKVREAVREKLVCTDGLHSSSQSGSQRKSPPPSDAETIAVAAERGVAVIREHRTMIARGKSLANAIITELEDTTRNIKEIEADIEAETAGDKSGKRRTRMLRAVSLQSRTAALASAAHAIKTFLVLDRQAFNLDDTPPPGKPGAPDANRFIMPIDPIEASRAYLALMNGGG